jgi:hypothetical protein
VRGFRRAASRRGLDGSSGAVPRNAAGSSSRPRRSQSRAGPGADVPKSVRSGLWREGEVVQELIGISSARIGNPGDRAADPVSPPTEDALPPSWGSHSGLWPRSAIPGSPSSRPAGPEPRSLAPRLHTDSTAFLSRHLGHERHRQEPCGALVRTPRALLQEISRPGRLRFHSRNLGRVAAALRA